MRRLFPDPETLYPLGPPATPGGECVVFLKPAIDHPRWEIGDYSYASAFAEPADWARHLAPYLFEFSPEKLQIGKFCQIADNVRFITASANHRRDGFTTFPFGAFDGGGSDRPSLPEANAGNFPDTIIGHDVWLGHGACVLPGARVGHGVIVGAGAVVGGTVPDYSVIVGNPARVVRRRFYDDTIAALLDLKWWNWPISRILDAEATICGADLAQLLRFANEGD